MEKHTPNNKENNNPGRLIIQANVQKSTKKLAQSVSNTFIEKLQKSPHIQEDIVSIVPNKINSKEPTIIAGKIGNIQVIRAYVDGEIIIASKTSSGSNQIDRITGRAHTTPRFGGGALVLSGKVDREHYSGSYGTSGPIKKGEKGAKMPYAIHITGPYWIHESKKATGKPESHGCLRVPSGFAKYFFDFVRSYPANSVTLITEKLY